MKTESYCDIMEAACDLSDMVYPQLARCPLGDYQLTVNVASAYEQSEDQAAVRTN